MGETASFASVDKPSYTTIQLLIIVLLIVLFNIMYLNPKDYYDSSRNLETTTTNSNNRQYNI